MIYKFKTEQAGIPFDFDIEFDKDQKINCIIGKNGIGKTQLLENMAKSLIYCHSMFSMDERYEYGRIFIQKHVGDKIEDIDIKLPLNIEINNTKIKDKKNQNWGYTNFDQIEMNRNNSLICDQPIVFIGAQNRGYAKNIDPNNIKILSDKHGRFVESITRTMDYINGNGLEHEEIANWFVSRLIINPNFVYAEQNKTNEVITVLKLIERLEPSIKLVQKNESGGNSLSMVYHEGQLLINSTPLNKLSTGFISIIKIFQEIVAGYGGWSNLNELNELKGIVFIDEIEPHLHISWQTKIVNILKEFFPNTTFYITTHSPLVLSGLKEGEAYELYEDKANDNIKRRCIKNKKIKNIENYFLNDIVKEFFDVDLNKTKIDKPDKEKQKKARELLLNLTKSFQEDKE